MATKSSNYGKGVKSNQRTVVQPSWGKFWLGVIAFILVAAILVGVMGWRTNGFVDWTFGFGEKPPVVDELGEPNNMVVATSVTEGAPIKLKAMPRTSSGAHTPASSYVISVTVTPDTASDKSVTVSTAWANATSEWAADKSVTDYIGWEWTSETHFAIALECKQAFGEQIIITFASVSNPEITATCTCDYIKRVEKVTIISPGGSEFNEESYAVNYNVTYGLGTLQGEFTFNEMWAELSTEFFVALENNNPYYSRFEEIHYEKTGVSFGEFVQDSRDGNYETTVNTTCYNKILPSDMPYADFSLEAVSFINFPAIDSTKANAIRYEPYLFAVWLYAYDQHPNFYRLALNYTYSCESYNFGAQTVYTDYLTADRSYTADRCANIFNVSDITPSAPGVIF